MSEKENNDIDQVETDEWLESIESVIQTSGLDRAKFLLDKIQLFSNTVGRNFFQTKKNQDYVNSIPLTEEFKYPGDIELERKIHSAVCWNAIIMVLRAYRKNMDLGGHISSFQSSSTIYEVCFNHFFRGKNDLDGGDFIYFQGHISPGIYSRAFLEGRLTKKQLNNFRQEIGGFGLSSYPHPKLMPKFWQFPTVSMGLGPICSIYQAKFLKYLKYRNIKDTSKQKVYAFIGDGEMDEPESRGALSIASREELDNLIFVVNCNLQRLDGPVFGNGKIINELEDIFLGSGWEVIKVIWGSGWDDLLKRDTTGMLIRLMNETVDGDYQNFRSKNGSYIRNNFFGKYKETLSLVENMSDEDIWNLQRGGHDPKKIYTAFKKALSVRKKPVVILFHTVKGYGIGNVAEGKNIAHQIKYFNMDTLMYIKNRFKISLTKLELEKLSYVSFVANSKEYKYIQEKRKKLGGFLPTRCSNSSSLIFIPELDDFKSLLIEQKKDISTTIAFVRFLNILLRNKKIKNHIVPIIADEARTFGMEGLFRKIGIYNFRGQKYIPQDNEQVFYYKEEKKGQILQEGINELGASASWLAAATSYSSNNLPMIPFYIYYSMFGFQRTGDLFWAAGDQQARGFLIGATSGRTTLNGEGLQHQDGHSHVYSSTIPNCISYDPSYAYELAVILQDGLKRMYGVKQENIFYYITTLNEKYSMPSMPKDSCEGICKGIYKLETWSGNISKVQLLGSGAILQSIRIAAKILSKDFNISSDVYSVTSFTELARNGQDCERWNMINPEKKEKIPFLKKIMNSSPAIASTDYVKLYAEQIRGYLPTKNYRVLGTDGFGRSDSRENLRNYFEIDAIHIVVAALFELSKLGKVSSNLVSQVINKFKINVDKDNPRLS
ncbi:MAG: pyruvate dehydrogenase (acetyl-transferring), homodimeric type [Buchnera aphidicola (Tetraneura akinire)]